jgi:Lar family restriction alleviation protein
MTPTTPSPISDQAAGELLPCPFCGCSIFPSDLTGEGTRYMIRCQDCPGRMEFFSSDKEQAISAWNRRSTAPTTGSAPVAEIVRWKTFTGHDGWDIKIFDKDIAHGTKLYDRPASPTASALTDEHKDAIGRIEYFLKAWEFNGVGKTIKTVQDSPDSCAAIDVADLRALLAASMGGGKS